LELTKPEKGMTHRMPTFLPDGRRFIYVVTGAQEIHVRILEVQPSHEAPGVNCRDAGFRPHLQARSRLVRSFVTVSAAGNRM
jgi:hypothetical protein